MLVSVLIPVFNEEENLAPLQAEIAAMAADAPFDVEVIYVDDGSTDGSFAVLAELAAENDDVAVIQLRRNFGQTAGLAAAIDHARGDVLVPMDADRQNDPADIPRMIAKLEDGYDVVSGWRKDRKDGLWLRRLPSRIANRLISRWTGLFLHDYGCSLKAYRAEAMEGVRLYGDMHRFVPLYAHWRGARVTEMVVNHRPRTAGVSKYGIERTFKVVLDMITVKFLGDYATKPIRLFGGMGIIMMLLSALLLLAGIVEKIIWNAFDHRFSLLILSTFLATIGVLLIMMGLLAEIMVRTYHESQAKRIYVVKQTLGAGTRDGLAED